MRYYLAWASVLLLAATCRRPDDPITQQQITQKQQPVALKGYLARTPRDWATWKLIWDIRSCRHEAVLWAKADPLRNYSPFYGHAIVESHAEGQYYPNLTAFRADIQRRTDSLRQTGPLNLSDTLYTPTEELHLQENARKLYEYYKEHPELPYAHP